MAVGHGIGQDHLGQEREVRIVRLAVAVGVPVHAHEILIVLKRDEPGGVGAERARLVVVTLRLYKKGGIVNDIGEIRHHVVVRFHTHAHFDAALLELHAVLLGHVAHPVRPHAARRKDRGPAAQFALVGDQAAHFAVLDDDVPGILARTDGHAALTERFAHAVDMIRQAIAPQMLLTDEQQIDAVFFGFLADGFGILHVRGKYRGRHAETVKNGLRLFDKAFRFGAGHELGEIGLAELVDEVQLAVREQPASAHPRKDMAGVALHAFLGLAERTAALLDHVAALHNAHRQIRMVGQPPSREQPGRAAAHDDDVKRVRHKNPPKRMA